jgi:hypothetical protein
MHMHINETRYKEILTPCVKKGIDPIRGNGGAEGLYFASL